MLSLNKQNSKISATIL